MSSDFVSAKNNVDINVPVNVVIKAFIKAEVTADDGSANSSDVSAHAPLFDEAILALFRSDTEKLDFSGLSALETA